MYLNIRYFNAKEITIINDYRKHLQLDWISKLASSARHTSRMCLGSHAGHVTSIIRLPCPVSYIAIIVDAFVLPHSSFLSSMLFLENRSHYNERERYLTLLL